jgi:small redox-active disulfide protein 2
MEIKILGTGCPNCKRLERNTREAVAMMAAQATITKVTEMSDILSYPILATPGLVIDGKVVCSGRVPAAGEISTMIANALVSGRC